MTQARILITDDDDMALEMLAAALQDVCVVRTAHQGEEALTLAAEQDFDLILLDVQMPGMDGYEVCQALKAHGRTAQTPVIFLSARVTLEERLRGYQAGGCDYVTKPFDVAELKTKIGLAVQAAAHSKSLNARIEEAMNTVMTTTDMYGEMGVVLGLQRALGDCRDDTEMADAFFDALEKSGFEGCLRLSSRRGALSRSMRADCSGLENSLLDHIAASSGPHIQAIGEHTFFRHGPVAMLIRQLPVTPSFERFSAEEIDRFGRARDNIALMAEGIVSRLHALDMKTDKPPLAQTRHLVDATREALVDITAQQHINRMQMNEVLQRMNSEIEASFINLGLSETQEAQLSDTLRRHIDEALGVFDHDNQIASHLNRLIDQLEA